MALACIGTAVTLYPVVKRQSEGVALGFVAARVLEAGIIFTGVVSLLSLVTLRQDLGGGRSKRGRARHHQRVARRGLQLDVPARTDPHAGHQRTAAGHLLYRSRLVPRIIPVLGLIGGPLLIAAVIATLFGQHSSVAGAAASR